MEPLDAAVLTLFWLAVALLLLAEGYHRIRCWWVNRREDWTEEGNGRWML